MGTLSLPSPLCEMQHDKLDHSVVRMAYLHNLQCDYASTIAFQGFSKNKECRLYFLVLNAYWFLGSAIEFLVSITFQLSN